MKEVIKINKITKQEKIGLALGSVSFLPVFLTIVIIGISKWWLAFILLFITQNMWLTSIHYCTRGLEIKNRKLRERIKELEGNSNVNK